MLKSESHIGQMPINQNNRIISEEYKLALSVDFVIFGYEANHLKVLLIPSDMPEYEGKLSLLGDLVHTETNLKDAAQAILEKRTGMNKLHFEQVGTFGNVNRHPIGRVVTVAYLALMKIDNFQSHAQSGPEPQWFPVGELEDLAFDHSNILKSSLKQLQLRLMESPLSFRLLPEKFTLRELQGLYEAVFNTALDKRNFRRKLKSGGLVKPLEETQKAVHHRPAQLYAFDKEKYMNNHKKRFFFNF